MAINLRQMAFLCTAKNNFLIHQTIKNEVARLEREGIIQDEEQEQAFIDQCSKLVNIGRLGSQHFNYLTMNILVKLSKLVKYKKHIGRKKLVQKHAKIPIGCAKSFLKIYKKNYTVKSALLKKQRRLQGNDQKIAQLEREIQVLERDIQSIEVNEEDFITITFPPQINLGRVTPDQQLLIREFGSQEVIKQLESIDAVSQKIKKYLHICSSRVNFDDIFNLIFIAPDVDSSIVQMFSDACLDNMRRLQQFGARTRSTVCQNIEGLLRAHQDGDIHLKESDLDAFARSRINLAARPIIRKESAAILKHNKQLLGITKDDLILMNLLDKLESDFRLVESEKQALANLLVCHIGDMQFRKRLSYYSKVLGNQSDTSSLGYFLYKTYQFRDKMDYVLKRANKVVRGHIHSKLTISEIGILKDMMKVYKKFQRLETKGIIEKHHKLKSLFKNLRHASQLLEFIQKKSHIDTMLKDGDLMMTQISKSSCLKNKGLDQETMLTQSFISSYGHAASVFKDEENQYCMSHIYGGHEIGRVDVSDMVVANLFRLNPYQLMSVSKQEMISEAEVQKIFQDKFRQLQISNQSSFAHIINDKKMRFKAGLAGFGIYGGHHRRDPNHPAWINHKLQNSSYRIKNKMICSEFVARCLISALFETNKQLKEQFGTRENFIQIPFTHEKIQRIHPQRLISLLERTGALQQIEVGSYLKSIIDFQSTQFVSHHPECLPENIFKNTLMKLARRYNINTFIVKGIDACESYSRRECLDVDFQDPLVMNALSDLLQQYYEHPHPETFIEQLVHFIKKLFGYGKQANITFKGVTDTLEEKARKE